MSSQKDLSPAAIVRVRATGCVHSVIAILFAVLLMVHSAGSALADPADAHWSSDFGAPGLYGNSSAWGFVRATVNWNGTLVVGGSISHAGGNPVQNIAAWNGTEFAPLGDGLNGTVTSLAAIGSVLYAAGEFTASGGTALPNVARWTGVAWAPVGSGAPDDPTDLALAIDDGTLLLLGQFSSIGSPAMAARCVARWNGAAWSDLGGFAPPESAFGYLRAAAKVGSMLYVGGYFDDESAPDYLNRFDGTSWTYNLGSLDGEVRELTAVGSDLYLQGDFISADGGNTPVQYIARWSGSTFSPLTDDTPDILDMGVDAGDLFVVGHFTNHPGPYCSGWDGSSWNAGPARIWAQNAPGLTAFARVGSDLFLAGNINGFYDYTDGGVIKGASGIVSWDGTRFRALGPGFGVADDRRVYALTTFDGQLVAAGDFTLIGRLGDARGIAGWDGTQWLRLGAGLTHTLGNPSGDRLTLWNGRVVVTGYFTGAGAASSQHIAAWNGASWEGFNGGFAGQGASVVDYGGQLIAGGLLQTEIGSGAPLGHVARWSGVQWQTIGTVAPASGASATKVAVWNGQLICAGLFDSIDGVGAQSIALWNGTSWSALGNGLNGLVTAIGARSGELYASGDFTASGATPLPGHMARWTGSAWAPVGPGIDVRAEAMMEAEGKLFVTGGFSAAGGAGAARIASWDGSTWTPLGSGLGQGTGGNGGSGFCLASFNGGLFVGGGFTTAGDKSSQKIARWTLGAAASVEVDPPASVLSLDLVSRNPATEGVRLALRLPRDSDVGARVFDARGRLVREVALGPRAAGTHLLAWDGRDEAGAALPTGVYWVQVVTTDERASRKVTWIR